jgi:hypothetical protein
MQQRVIVERIGVHDRVLKDRRSAIFPPAVIGRDLNQFPERRDVLLVRFDILYYRKSENENERALPIR